MIKVIAVDDELLALNALIKAIEEAITDVEIFSFQKVSELLQFPNIKECSIAFLDIQMPKMNGILLAKKIKDINHNINIIFVTGYSEYAIESFNLHASGYIMKPVTSDLIKEEVQNLRNQIINLDKYKIRVKTFGNFEVFKDNKLVVFSRNICKEIFAYLIDRNGTSATFAEIASVIWDDGLYDRSRQKQLYGRIFEMIKTFEEIGEKDIIIKRKTGIMVDTTKIDCDAYRFLNGDVTVINSYRGEYMNSYSWAEFTNAILFKKMID